MTLWDRLVGAGVGDVADQGRHARWRFRLSLDQLMALLYVAGVAVVGIGYQVFIRWARSRD